MEDQENEEYSENDEMNSEEELDDKIKKTMSKELKSIKKDKEKLLVKVSKH